MVTRIWLPVGHFFVAGFLKRRMMKRRGFKMTILAAAIILTVILAIDFVSVEIRAMKRFASYTAGTEMITTSYGKITYIDEGEGVPVLVCHGICGGYDQGFDVLGDKTDLFRVIAPSRFGYPGSDMPENADIDMQVEAFVELLDQLGIDKPYVLATSAGGTVAIRYAIVHPERCRGLILYCSGYPELTKPEKTASYAGPPAFFCNDLCMWMLSPLFKPLMGMERDTVNTILPMKDRKEGIVFDGRITNTDKTNNYENYDMRALECPVLIIHSGDDKLADYESAKAWSTILKDCTFLSFSGGGHLMKGHEEEIENALKEFTEAR